MNKKIIECVPNFSEGRDMTIIGEIAKSIESIDGVKILNIDSGEAANRTVFTFVGEADKTVEAAFQSVKRAAQLIDMSKQHGTHPRIGSTDVCPLIPISGITMEETTRYARSLAQRIATEAKVPTYCYEQAAYTPERKKLAVCRKGEYEGLKSRFAIPSERPDFGGEEWNDSIYKTGCTVVGSRDYLIAINYNLNTTSTKIASAIAADVRETGRKTSDKDGNLQQVKGTLKNCAAIGWYIEEYGIAQVSMNITSTEVTPIHIAFEEVSRRAAERGVQVTGVEIIGLVPKNTLIDAGKYFLAKEHLSTEISDEELIEKAIKTMNLDELRPFNPKTKIIEYMI